MPEGDTIARAARTLRAWLAGRAVTSVHSPVLGRAADQLVGLTVTGVDARGKHLLVRFANGLALHTHLRMTGSWHVYPAGERWQRPARQARVVLQAGDRVAVCFNAPVVELLTPADLVLHPSLRGLGPDVLAEPLDVDAIRRRARALPPETPVGDVLLDQRVVSGIGNIWRCEALFACRVSPATPAGALGDAAFDDVVRAAARLMRASVDATRPPTQVYGRAKRPCPRCGTGIRARRQGRDARIAYWCPRCQPGETQDTDGPALPGGTRGP